MENIEIEKTVIAICVGLPIMYFITVSYVYILIRIDTIFRGKVQSLIENITYFIYCCLFVAPLFYLMSIYESELRKNTVILISTILSYCLIMVPAAYYFYKKTDVLPKKTFVKKMRKNEEA